MLGPGQSSHTHSCNFHSALLLLGESQISVRSFTGKGIGVALAKHMMAEGLSFCCLAHTLVYIYSACAIYIHTYIHNIHLYCIPYSSDAGGNIPRIIKPVYNTAHTELKCALVPHVRIMPVKESTHKISACHVNAWRSSVLRVLRFEGSGIE